jgi:hypothetical protein
VDGTDVDGSSAYRGDVSDGKAVIQGGYKLWPKWHFYSLVYKEI